MVLQSFGQVGPAGGAGGAACLLTLGLPALPLLLPPGDGFLDFRAGGLVFAPLHPHAAAVLLAVKRELHALRHADLGVAQRFAAAGIRLGRVGLVVDCLPIAVPAVLHPPARAGQLVVGPLGLVVHVAGVDAALA